MIPRFRLHLQAASQLVQRMADSRDFYAHPLAQLGRGNLKMALDRTSGSIFIADSTLMELSFKTFHVSFLNRTKINLHPGTSSVTKSYD